LHGSLRISWESIKHYLWHGNRFEAQRHLHELEEELEEAEVDFPTDTVVGKLLRGVREFGIYIKNNQNLLVDYGEHYRNEETISTTFVKSTVNWVI
jgi:hypothetical protein